MNDTTYKLTEIEATQLVKMLADGKNPIIGCAEESHFSCPYKREYEKRLDRYNIERLIEFPECESCGCAMVVIDDE